MNFIYILAAVALLTSTAMSAVRNLIVVNGLGETLDKINLEDSSVSLGIDVLGLFPNDFVTIEDVGIEINSGSNDLYFYDMAAITRIGACFIGDGRNPYKGAFLNADTFYVTNLISSTVTKVDVASRSVIEEFAVGDGLDSDSPQGIVIRDRKAYICMTSFNELFEYDSGKVEIWDLNADTLLERIIVGINPQVAEFGRDGYLYVLCTGNYTDIGGWLFKIYPNSNQVSDSLEVGGSPGGIAITKQNVAFLAAGGWPPPVKRTIDGLKFVNRFGSLQKRDALANGLVYTVDLNAFAVLHGDTNPLSTDFGVTSLLALSDSTVVTCNFADDTITEIDSAGTILARFNVGDGPVAIAKNPACYAIRGDADFSGNITVSDAVFMINFIFAGGATPIVVGSGDMDCNDIYTISDAVAIINFIFAGGMGSCGCAD